MSAAVSLVTGSRQFYSTLVNCSRGRQRKTASALSCFILSISRSGLQR